MALKQISVSIPQNLFKATKEYSEEYGYENVQELIRDMLRKKVLVQRIDRYKKIEEEINKESKAMTQKEAIKFIEGL